MPLLGQGTGDDSLYRLDKDTAKHCLGTAACLLSGRHTSWAAACCALAPEDDLRGCPSCSSPSCSGSLASAQAPHCSVQQAHSQQAHSLQQPWIIGSEYIQRQ